MFQLSSERASTAEAALVDSEDKQHAAVSRCEELLKEMNEVNGVLRDRGERISRLEATLKTRADEYDDAKLLLSRLQETVKQLETDKQAGMNQLESLQNQLTVPSVASTDEQKMNDRIKELEFKLQELQVTNHELTKTATRTVRESIPSVSTSVNSGNNNASAECQSEVMSTSTTSKAEETHRLKDIEDTFEERYMKLKSVAIKLKKKLAEQTIQLNAAEEAKNKLMTEHPGSMKAATKNIQILQGEIDRLQDTIDSGKRSLKERDCQLTEAVQQLADAREQLADQEIMVTNLTATVQVISRRKMVELHDCYYYYHYY